jgi:hypothetical protein
MGRRAVCFLIAALALAVALLTGALIAPATPDDGGTNKRWSAAASNQSQMAAAQTVTRCPER